MCPRGVGMLCAEIQPGGTYSFSLLFPTLGADMASHHAPPFLLGPAETLVQPAPRFHTRETGLLALLLYGGLAPSVFLPHRADGASDS